MSSLQKGDAQLQTAAQKVLIWHCKHPHGLFSMFSLALGHAETCEKLGMSLVVDWSGEELLYRGPPGQPNLWNTFFHQPAALQMPLEELKLALQHGHVVDSDQNKVVFGDMCGVVQERGNIPKNLASRGRALCRRIIVLQHGFEMKLNSAIERLLLGAHRWLAVHIRRSDKHVEAAANLQLTHEALKQRIFAQCSAWQMDGVFLCSDDADLKEHLRAALTEACLAVSIFPATLPTDSSKAVHFDTTIDSYQKAEDVVLETFIMARGCHGLLSTYSNVSASVVYLSHDDYPYCTFWDPVERHASKSS